MNDESGEEDQEEEEYDSEDDETYDGTEEDEERSDDQFVNESSDEGVGGIENDYDSDGNLIDDESDDDDDYDDEDDEDDAIGNVGNPNGGFHPLLHAHPMFQQALLQSLVQEEENTGDVPHPHAVAQIIQDMQHHFLQHHQHQIHHHHGIEEGEFEDQYDMMMFDGGGGGAYSGGSSSSDEEDDSFFRDTEDEESESESESSSEEEEEGKREGRDAAEQREHPHSSRISERIRVRDELEEDATRRTGRSGGAPGENNNTRKRKNEMVEEEKIKVDGEDDDEDDDDEEEDRDFDPDESETSSSGPSVVEDDGDDAEGKTKNNKLKHHNYDTLTYDHDHLNYTEKHGCRIVRRVVDTLMAGGKIATAMVHKQGADAVCPIPMSCADPDLKSNALPYASEVLLLGTNKVRALKAIGDKKRCTKTVLDETDKLPFKIYSASVCPEMKMIAICGVHDHGTRGGLSEGSANVAVFSLNPEDMTRDGHGSIISDNPRNAQPQERFKFLGIENIGFPHDERITHDGRLIDPVLDSNSSDVAEQANCIRWGTHTRLKEEYIEEYEKRKAKALTKESNKAKRNQPSSSSSFDEAQFRKEYIEEAKNHFETKRVLLLSSNDGHVYILAVEKFDAKTLMEKAEKREKRLHQLNAIDGSGFSSLTRLELFRLKETHKIIKLDAIFVGAPVNCAVSHPSGKYLAVATDSTIIPVIGNEIFGYSSSFDSIKETIDSLLGCELVHGFELSFKRGQKGVGFENVTHTYPNGSWLDQNNATSWRERSGDDEFRLNRMDVVTNPFSELAYHHTPLVFRPEDLSETGQNNVPIFNQEGLNNWPANALLRTSCQYLAFSPNGKYLAATSDNRKSLSVWRVEQPSDVFELECFDYPTETRPFRVMHALMINPLVKFNGFHLPLLPLAFAPSNDDILMVAERGNKQFGTSGAHVIDLSKFEKFGGYIHGRRKAFEQNVRETIEKNAGKDIHECRAFYKSNGEKLLNSVEPDPNWYRQLYERVVVTTFHKPLSVYPRIPVAAPLNSMKLKPNWTLGLSIYEPYERKELDHKQNMSRKLLPIDWTSQTRLMFYEIAIPNSTFIGMKNCSEGSVIGVDQIDIMHVNFGPDAGHACGSSLDDPAQNYFNLKSCMQTISEPFERNYITGLSAVGPPPGSTFNNTYPDIFYVTTPTTLEIFRFERGWSPMTVFRSSNRRLKFYSGRTRKMQWHNSMFSTDFRDAALTLLLCAHRVQKTNANKKRRPREETTLGDLTNDCVLKIIEKLALPASDWIDRDHDMYVEAETIVLSDGKGEAEKIDLY